MPGNANYDELSAYLGADTAGALRAWRDANRFVVEIPSQPWESTDGYSGAKLHTIIVDDLENGPRLLIVKTIPPVFGRIFDPPPDMEPERHRAALRAASNPFAAAHMVRQPFPALPTCAGNVLMFQTLASDGAAPLSLADFPPTMLSDACAKVVSEVVGSWNHGSIQHGKCNVGAFLREEVGRALTPTGTIRGWAEPLSLLDNNVTWIVLDGNDYACPNPLLLALGRLPWPDLPVGVLRGCMHGDLHLLNVLVKAGVGMPPDIETFQLIDLATFSAGGSLTHDPVCLMLSAVALTIGTVPPQHHDELIDVIVGAAPRLRTELPFQVVTAVRQAFDDAVTKAVSGWSGSWPTQFLLSILAFALVFTSFERLDGPVRWWFLRLSARAGLRFAERLKPKVPIPLHGHVVKNPFPRLPFAGQTLSGRHSGSADERMAAHEKSLRPRYLYAQQLERAGRAAEALELYKATLAAAEVNLGSAHQLTAECRKAVWSRNLQRRAEEEADEQGNDAASP